MNILIVGLPGNGKGVCATTLLDEELRLGVRPVITNLAVETCPWIAAGHKARRGLRDYYLEKYNEDFNLRERIFRVTDDAIKNFYLYRALTKKQIAKIGDQHLKGYRKVELTDGVMTKDEFLKHEEYELYVCDNVTKADKSGNLHCASFNSKLLELSGAHFNIADECWKFWPARGWQSTSEADVYYNAQHRHFGDDNLYLTQRDNDIDSIIVGRCQESYVMTHHGKMTFSVFRQPDVFTAAIYNGRPMPSKEPMSRKVFRLNKGLMEGYDTSAGVGISGRGAADMGSRKKGLPFWLMPAGVLALLVVVGFTITKGSHFIGHMFAGKSPVQAVAKPNVNPVANPVIANVTQERPEIARENYVSVQETNEVYCTGYSLLFGNPTVFLSDGSVVKQADGLQSIEREAVIVSGKRYRVKAANLPAEDWQSGFAERNRNQEPYEILSAERPINEANITVIGSRASRRPAASGSASIANRMSHGAGR